MCGDFGLVALNSTASAALWNKAGPASRCAIGADGTVAALVSGAVVAIGQDGKLYFTGTSAGGTGASVFARDPTLSAKA